MPLPLPVFPSSPFLPFFCPSPPLSFVLSAFLLIHLTFFSFFPFLPFLCPSPPFLFLPSFPLLSPSSPTLTVFPSDPSSLFFLFLYSPPTSLPLHNFALISKSDINTLLISHELEISEETTEVRLWWVAYGNDVLKTKGGQGFREERIPAVGLLVLW